MISKAIDSGMVVTTVAAQSDPVRKLDPTQCQRNKPHRKYKTEEEHHKLKPKC